MDFSRLVKVKEDFIRDVEFRLSKDPNVAALALIGSHAEGTQKPLSDIDLIIVVNDSTVSEYTAGDSWLLGDKPVLARHSAGRVIFEDFVCLDATIVCAGDLAAGRFNPITRRALRKAIRPLFDPKNLIQDTRFAIGDEEDNLYTTDEGLDKFCYYALLASFRIKRGELWLAHDNIFFDMKQILILLLKAHLGLGHVDWVKGAMEIDHPLADAIWNIFPTVGDASDLGAALVEIVNVGMELVATVDPEGESEWPAKFEEILAIIEDVLRPIN
jgi:hypothetical protein